jgi:hypothetical protein
MPEHFSKATVQATFRCAKCNKDTPHHVADGRRAGCMVCMAKPQPPEKPKKQERLF